MPKATDPVQGRDVGQTPPVHRYETSIAWDGSTGEGYDAYGRGHRATVPPVPGELALSGDPAFGGDRALLNPEQLLVLAAASCQLLSFLAIAARARLDVVSYRDDAVGEMPERDDGATAITEIRLRPRIEVRGTAPRAKVERLVGLAHGECYIANSLRTAIVVEPTITFVP